MKVTIRGKLAAAVIAAALTGGPALAQVEPPTKSDLVECMGTDGKLNQICASQFLAAQARNGNRGLGCSGLTAILKENGVQGAEEVAKAIMCKVATPQPKQ